MKCPKCDSNHIDYVDEQGIKVLICLDCGYDESEEYEITAEEKSNQKAKGSYTRYKTGGGKRSGKIK